MSTNAVASMAKQWPSPTQESMNNTWKCLFLLFCFESLFFLWRRYLKRTYSLNILLLRKIFYIPLYSVLNEYVMCTNVLFMGKNKEKRKKQ